MYIAPSRQVSGGLYSVATTQNLTGGPQHRPQTFSHSRYGALGTMQIGHIPCVLRCQKCASLKKGLVLWLVILIAFDSF